MAAFKDNLTPKQIEVLTHLVAGSTVVRAARKASVHRSTIYLWLKECPAFHDQLNHHRALLTDAIADRVRELQLEALDALEESLCGPEATPAVRLRAALFVLGGSPGALDKTRHFSNSSNAPLYNEEGPKHDAA